MRFTADRFDEVTTSTIGEWAGAQRTRLPTAAACQLYSRRQRSSKALLLCHAGVDFRVKYLTINGKRVKLAVW
jgi:hypothetical protein